MILTEPTDTTVLRAAFGCFPSGVTAICAVIDGEPAGMAVSSFTSVSLEPPLISVCIQNTSRTWVRLRRAARIGVSVLADRHGDHCRRLSRRTGDRFGGIPWDIADSGAMFVRGAPAQFDCSLHREVEAGDHSIALLRVHALAACPASAPLVFHGSTFRRLA
ncbi:flavin reductase (DIM6/NTAB) family NADH-FMN oxidoreductase RutF [Thermocatellispora tengchongensis]|uniref:Flavin reductase (DIM6/NTAB) family NADH-FMN oxidoreductase RutF n=1 Tax=Thermocatellispora tengchongensis TaxID=1073253 RepID=A0A840P939_9ACTN|nr:flavin reductase family protein [Thermocatellispora tengchongensis]MBB5137894.1 flavin reductase (DIM6/NTAB) family NADH-FMN oxidoreductase RutF [Thermocatellispora tengchongensis]